MGEGDPRLGGGSKNLSGLVIFERNPLNSLGRATQSWVGGPKSRSGVVDFERKSLDFWGMGGPKVGQFAYIFRLASPTNAINCLHLY